MSNFKLSKILIFSDSKLRQAMELINDNSFQVCFVVDQSNKLIGAVTDGDIRRAFLRGANLDTPVSDVMSQKPKFLSDKLSRHEILEKMKEFSVKQMPLVDANGVVTKVEFLDDILGITKRDNQIVLMVGGVGKRLSPLTDSIPKPLLPVCGVPILERIILRFKEVGFYNFIFVVNYKAEMIESHFKNGHKWNVNIEYVHEKQPLGTCGGLSLLKQAPQDHFIVMNGDLLTQANFAEILDYHRDLKSLATMCVREFEVQVPYGVVKVDGSKIKSIDEKPKETAYINSGIYVFSPQVFEYIPKNQYFDMPSLFNSLGEKKLDTHIYNLKEYWLDIGRVEDYQKAQIDYEMMVK